MFHASRRSTSGVLVGLLAAVVLAGCGGAGDPVPPELLQIWTTEAPAYKDRYFELRDGMLVFGTGRHTFVIHIVKGVEATRIDQSSVEYVFDYRDVDGEIAQVQFVHTTGTPPTIRMANHNEVWIPQHNAAGEG